MSRRPSLKNQVDRLLRSLFQEGASRHEAKLDGTAQQRIFSYGTLDTYRDRCLILFNALGDDKPRMLRDVTPQLVERGLSILRERGASDAHLKTTLAALRKLGEGMYRRQWNPHRPDELVPEHLYTGLTRSAARGGYSPEHLVQIRAALALRSRGDELVRMFDLLRTSGLRHAEVIRLRESDLDREHVVITVRGTNAKGGKQRIVGPGLDPDTRAELRQALDGISIGRHWLWTDGPALGRRLQDAMRQVCVDLDIHPKGVHGLRASFAEQFLLRRMEAGLAERDARLELSRQLGHNRVDVTYRYVPPLG